MNPEAIKQFLIGTVVPVFAGSIGSWLVGTKVLSFIGITSNAAAKGISTVLTFAVIAGLSWLTTHHILLGHYTPAAKAGAGKR